MKNNFVKAALAILLIATLVGCQENKKSQYRNQLQAEVEYYELTGKYRIRTSQWDANKDIFFNKDFNTIEEAAEEIKQWKIYNAEQDSSDRVNKKRYWQSI